MARALTDAAISRVFLTGFMGAGKSTTGPILARRLGWSFLDLDAEIERESGLSVPEIFAREGEEGFRRAELLATRRVLERERIVVATGGGWVTLPELGTLLPEGSVTVWLRLSEASLGQRLSAAGMLERPLLAPGIELAAALMAAREHLYRRADFSVATDGRLPEEVTEEIVSLLLRRGAAPRPRERPES